MRQSFIFALLACSMPVLAQSPTTQGGKTSPTPPATAVPSVSAATGPPVSLLDSLVGRKQIVGLTKQDGTRFLCRFNSGDHGQYIVQEFHFAGPPKISYRTVPPSQGAPVPHYQTITIGSGRGRHRMRVLTGYTQGRASAGGRTQVRTETTLPDPQAVSLLLLGVAGTNHHPLEVELGRETILPAQIKVLQLLTPPPVSSAAKTLPASAVGSPAVSGPPADSPAAPSSLLNASANPTPPAGGVAGANSAQAWTLTTLWPSPAGGENVPPAGRQRRKASR